MSYLSGRAYCEALLREDILKNNFGKDDIMENIRRFNLKKTIVFMLSFLFVVMSFELCSGAAVVPGGSSSADVMIEVNNYYEGVYRYSFDIVHYNMTFTFNLRAVEHNMETGERYISYGDWLLSDSKRDSVDITIVNHADTPIRVSAKLSKSDFDKCGVSVEKEGLDKTFIPACTVINGDVKVNEEKMDIFIKGVPELILYKGEKKIYSTVEVVVASGYATNGSYFESPFGA